MIGAACCFPSAASFPVGAVLALLVTLIGLPHGAGDHRLARSRLEPLLGPGWWGVFLVGYLVIAAAVVLGWFVAPAATIILFFFASAWHFGQEEPDLLPCRRDAKFLRLVFRVARGGLVIWVPVVFQTAEVMRILSLTAPRGFASEIRWAVAVLVVCSWVMLSIEAVAVGWQAVSIIASEGRRRRVLVLDVLLLVSLATMFAWVNPVVGFLVYFCGWHSARGLRTLRRELGESWGEMAVTLAPMTLLSVALIGLATYLVLQASTWDDTLVRATFVGLSSVAVPHMLFHAVVRLIDWPHRQQAGGTAACGGGA